MTFGRTRQEQLARFAVVAMCLLVLVFSFAAKLSLYQPKSQQIRSLASSKMWQHEAAVMASPDGPELASLELVSGFFVLLMVVVAIRGTLFSLDRGVWLRREAAVAVRQQRFARPSQLRAPPVL
ncbi:hypothetical protein [Edaphobacter aggregans]|uniref:hypothetical protein n=1 Tax=Edaphobacter aggregans TaxID=570835 RepID=UPI0012F9BD6C|nr:hypothetical protein [Edaphobacter aggregans]